MVLRERLALRVKTVEAASSAHPQSVVAVDDERRYDVAAKALRVARLLAINPERAGFAVNVSQTFPVKAHPDVAVKAFLYGGNRTLETKSRLDRCARADPVVCPGSIVSE